MPEPLLSPEELEQRLLSMRQHAAHAARSVVFEVRRCPQVPRGQLQLLPEEAHEGGRRVRVVLAHPEDVTEVLALLPLRRVA